MAAWARLVAAGEYVRAEVREVFWAWRLELARWTHFVRRVTRHHLIDRSRMIEQAVRRVAHRTDHRELVIHLGELRQQLRELHSRQLRRDVAERTLYVVGNVFLRIPKVDVTRATLEINKDDALGFAPTGTATGCRGRASVGHCLEAKHIAKRKAQHARTTNTKKIATRGFQFVAKSFPA